MRTLRNSTALLCLMLSLPGFAAKLVDAPPPPPMADTEPEEEGKQPKPPAVIEKPSRGQQLYENHCTGCHESVVYIRSRRQARSLPELREAVSRWVSYTNLPWGREEAEEVVQHLNKSFYGFEK